MKVDNFYKKKSCWDFPNQIASCNAFDIFKNMTMNRGALTWVELFWSYDAKVIDYWTILSTKFNIIINKYCIWI
jgi:hypothetical protein